MHPGPCTSPSAISTRRRGSLHQTRPVVAICAAPPGPPQGGGMRNRHRRRLAGGLSASERARRLDEHAVVVLEQGASVSFVNCGLPYHLSGEIAPPDALLLHTQTSLATCLNLDRCTGQRVADTDTQAAQLTIAAEDDPALPLAIPSHYWSLANLPASHPGRQDSLTCLESKATVAMHLRRCCGRVGRTCAGSRGARPVPAAR
jgi:hypothetical protein